MYLDKAVDLADRLLAAFDTPSGIPYSSVNLAQRKGIPDAGNQGMMSTAEASSVQLEMKYLSHLTGDYVYWRAAEKVGPDQYIRRKRNES
jgi:mannosyl-oligosaccharide alpha-1,2-mannosidase